MLLGVEAPTRRLGIWQGFRNAQYIGGFAKAKALPKDLWLGSFVMP